MSRLGHTSPHRLISRQNAAVTTLQFIASLKWPLLILILAGLVAVAIWRSTPETRAALRSAVATRGLKVGLPGGIDVDWSAPGSTDAVRQATAPDEQLIEFATTQGEAAPTAEQVQVLRRDAVERVMREAAFWGYSMARTGFRSPPVPNIQWDGDRPRITYGFTTTEQAVRHLVANQTNWGEHQSGA